MIRKEFQIFPPIHQAPLTGKICDEALKSLHANLFILFLIYDLYPLTTVADY